MLSASTIRNLGQKEYEKRKGAALEVENQVREYRNADDSEKIAQLITTIVNDLAESPQPNLRKGALHALAGTAIGLRQGVAPHLASLLKPVLTSFSDQDARVRYYGCEALYNIAKVARASCVTHFNDIFDGLFKLSADTDTQVQSGMQLLDRLMKDVVTEADNFDIEAFMPLLGERVYVINPFSRQFLVGWIATLDSVPDIEMLHHLPVFFDGLFHMLADPNKEIRSQTFAVLQDFLKEVRDADAISYAPIVHVLVQHSSSLDKFSRLTAITWLHTLVSHGREALLPFCAKVLDAVLASLAHVEDEIRDAASRADGTLRALLQASHDDKFQVHTLIHALASHLSSQHVGTLRAALGWVHMLLQKSAPRVMQLSSTIWPALFKCLSNPSEEVVTLDIEALAYMASSTQQHFGPFIDHLLRLFRNERPLLEARGTSIVRQLCQRLQPRQVFVTLAAGLQHEEDLEFASQMVQALNLILLTSDEAWELRQTLRQSQQPPASPAGGGAAAVSEEEGASFFVTLYPAWAHNPVALLSVCLLSQAYEHAAELVLQFGRLEMSVPFLVQIDRLVQLFESPILTHVRLQLLEPENHPYLLKALWGILMLLPQSPAYHTLKNRLSAVPEIGLLRLQLAHSAGVKGSSNAGAKGSGGGGGGGSVDFRKMLQTFEEVQAKHRDLHKKKQQQARGGVGSSSSSGAGVDPGANLGATARK